MPSTLFQSWASSLRIKWLSFKGRAQALAYATVLGDWTIDWMTAALYERMPSYASTATALPLIASERQLDVTPDEATTAIAGRAPQWINLGKYVGTAVGLLVGMHFAGFDNAVIVTQNGLAYQLALPLPPFILGEAWDPTGNLITSSLSTLSVPLHSNITLSRSIPTGASWWTMDSNTDFCSRFEILFPGPLPSYFVTHGTAVFTGAENGSTVPWPTVSWNNEFPDTSYHVQPSIPTATGPVIVYALDATKTMTGIQIGASAPFVGTVDVVAYGDGANPFGDLHPADLARLQNTVAKWKPERSVCLGVYALVQGNFIGWPVRTIGAIAPSVPSIAAFTAGF